jgi:hypothetical protein
LGTGDWGLVKKLLLLTFDLIPPHLPTPHTPHLINDTKCKFSWLKLQKSQKYTAKSVKAVKVYAKI